jgi:rhodanese-related sulfurtransferase
MNKFSLLFIAVIALCSCTDAQVKTSDIKTENRNTINKVVNPDEFKELMSNASAQLVDVRTANEYAAGKIGNAINIDYFGDDFKQHIAKLDKNKIILVYCAAGGRSAKASKIFSDMGFIEVYELKGGYGNWN